MLLGVDVGGTFTDAALLDGERLVTAKSPSTPRDQSEGVLAAIDAVLARAGARAADVGRFVHGMTVGTNALLEGRAARTALLATRGFTDVEELRRQDRAQLYRLCAAHPPPLASERVAVPERTGPAGVIEPLDEAELRERVAALPGDCESVAVCLLWGFRHPEHERAVAALLGELRPELHVSTSHETAAVFREYERCATTVVDAALSPLLRRYLERLSERAREAGLPTPEIMLSSGGVADASQAARHGSWTVLSGPAGGAVGAAWAARGASAVCVDMGGTSCDVSVALEGRPGVTGERELGDRPLALPMVDVHTIGAGGGSIAWRDAGGALRVGPRSAGADPGPAAYGNGGDEPTVTDANVVLGYLDAHSALAGGVELNADAARDVIGRLGGELGIDVVATAAGIARIASLEMARAVRVMTVDRGLDPRELELLAFGGAGPLHAAAIAEELGIRTVVVPRSSGVLSAVGMLVSERRRDLVESVLLAGDEITPSAVAEVVGRLAQRGAAEVGVRDPEVRAAYDLRYRGQAFELTIAGGRRPDATELRAAFEAAHRERFGFHDPDAELELVTVRVAVAQPGAEPALERTAPNARATTGMRSVVFGSERVEASVYGGLAPPGERVAGPSIWHLPETTLVVPPGWHAAANGDGVVLMERS
jgi:N-methylhydantoinase A